jgi:hypothetical protein
LTYGVAVFVEDESSFDVDVVDVVVDVVDVKVDLGNADELEDEVECDELEA